jgi:hypothetical protein
LEAQKNITEGNIKRLDQEITDIQQTLADETKLYRETYATILGEDKFTQEEIVRNADKTLIETDENNQDIATSHEETYSSALENVKDFTETAIKYLSILKRF